MTLCVLYNNLNKHKKSDIAVKVVKYIIMLRIQKNSINLEEKLGKGSFGIVYKATWESRKYIRDVAIKIVHEHIMSYQEVVVEADLLSKCNHQHIVECFGIVEDLLYPSTGIVMEYMSFGE